MENGKTYKLKNDIECSGDYASIIDKLNNKQIEIKSNEYKIINNGKYYTANSKYTIPVNKYGYVINGMELLLDGKDNEGTGKHNSSAAIWKDLSGKKLDGTLMNMDIENCWKEEGLKFDGIDDYVSIEEMNYENITLEVVTGISDYVDPDENKMIVSNTQSGGYAIYVNQNMKLRFEVYLAEDSSYYSPPVNNQSTILNNKYYISGSYDKNKIKILTSNISANYQEISKVGNIGYPKNNTYMMLGVNPEGNTPASSYFNGTIYSVRIYSKALSDEERAVNYANDKERYNV